jgi:hypothetical protein
VAAGEVVLVSLQANLTVVNRTFTGNPSSGGGSATAASDMVWGRIPVCSWIESQSGFPGELDPGMQTSGRAGPVISRSTVLLVNSDQIDKLGVVDHPSFAFWTCSNGLSRVPRRLAT